MTTLILSVLFSISASAWDIEVDGIYYNFYGTTLTVTSGKKYSGNIVIPESITYKGSKYPVTSIGGSAFSGCSGLTSVTIPNSVTSIGGYAFERCSGLTSVEIPNSVTIIDSGVFNGCSSLTSITIPNSVTSIGEWAFSGCSGLTSVEIPNSVTSIGVSAFEGCSGLTSVTIPNSVTSIGFNAFEGCSGLTSIEIPNSVTSIESAAFYKCSGLTSVTIPNSVTSIGDFSFSGCSGLTSVEIPNSVTSIEYGAFLGCSGLTSVTIPNSVTSIGDLAFYGCTGITQTIIVNDMFVFLPTGYEGHYSIPENISTIIGGAFKECSGLTTVTIPNSVTRIEDCAFEGCSGLTSVTIPNSVTSIGHRAFEGCSGLISVTIPNSVTSIGSEAFAKCGNLENVYCYAEKFSYIDDDIFKDSDIEYATLYVPSSAISYFLTTKPWSGFGTIKALEGNEKKCETPSISFVDGKLTFSCATEGVEYVSDVTCSDVSRYYSNEINLAACYDITCYAKAEGFVNSDVATAKLYWLTSSGSLEGAGINNVSMRGIAIQSAGGFVTISGLDNNEKVSFYGIDGKSLGSATAINGTTSFAAQSGSIVVAKIGKENIKIAVK